MDETIKTKSFSSRWLEHGKGHTVMHTKTKTNKEDQTHTQTVGST